MMKAIGITGGTGFVGRHLTSELLAAGHRVTVFSRSAKTGTPNLRYAHWDPDKKEIEHGALAELDAVVHLAGAGIADKRWTERRKQEILTSRVEGTRFLIGQLKEHAPACRSFVAASAIGYYGPDRGGQPFSEDDLPYHDFLGQVCVQWEAASAAAQERCRTVIFRFGVVLGKDGGAYPQLAGPMKLGVMPVLGDGEQMVSWVHVDDLAGMIRLAIDDEAFAGVYNAVSPHPVTHRQLMRTIARTKGGLKIPAPVPGFVLRVILGESSIEVLKSCTVSSVKLQKECFAFSYPDIESAVREIEGN